MSLTHNFNHLIIISRDDLDPYPFKHRIDFQTRHRRQLNFVSTPSSISQCSQKLSKRREKESFSKENAWMKRWYEVEHQEFPESDEFLVKLLISWYNNISQFSKINLMLLYQAMKVDDDNTHWWIVITSLHQNKSASKSLNNATAKRAKRSSATHFHFNFFGGGGHKINCRKTRSHIL